MATRKIRKSRPRKTVRRHKMSTAGKILPPLDVRTTKHLAEFEKRIKKGPLTIVLVYADWCGHCHTMMPHYDAASKSPKRSIQAVKVNEQMLQEVNHSINKNVNRSAKPLNVEGYPSIIVIDNKGNKVTDVEPVRDTKTMTELMSQAGPLATNAGLNVATSANVSTNEGPLAKNALNVADNAVVNSIKNVVKNTKVENKKRNVLTNLGIEEEGFATGGPRNSDVGEDELLGSIASKNKNSGVNKDLKKAEADAVPSLNTVSNHPVSVKAVPSADIKKEAEIITSLASPISPPSMTSDIEGEELSISNNLTPEQKISGGGRGGSLYSAMARTTYTLAPAAALLATAAMVMKGKKHTMKKGKKTYRHSKKGRKTHKRRH